MLLGLLLICSITAVLAGDVCHWFPNGSDIYSTPKRCSWGCCQQYTETDPCCLGMSDGGFVGVVTAGFFFLAMVAVGVLLFYRRRRPSHPTPITTYLPPDTSTQRVEVPGATYQGYPHEDPRPTAPRYYKSTAPKE